MHTEVQYGRHFISACERSFQLMVDLRFDTYGKSSTIDDRYNR